jgi:ubiquinol-cytochrome c reductase cytochrome c subunit
VFSWFRVFAVSCFINAAPMVGHSAAQTAATPAGSAQSGKDLYLKLSCYACHGYDGHGGAGARLVPMRMNQAGFALYIRNPRQMPPYTAKVLSDQQAADLWAYVKSMPESPSADKIPLLMRIIAQ